MGGGPASPSAATPPPPHHVIMPRRDEGAAMGTPEENGEVDGSEDGDMKPPAVDDDKFSVGNMTVDAAFVDSLLNKRKLELLHDPDIVSLLNRAMKKRTS